MLSLYLLVSLTFWCSSADPDSGSSSVFNQALESFKQSDLAKSRESFLQLIAQSPDDPVLLYNLGLIELTDQHPGRALAYWRKALYLKPGYRPAIEGISRIEKLKKSNLPAYSFWRKIPFYFSLSAWLGLGLFFIILTTLSAVRWRRAIKFQISRPTLTLPIALSGSTLLFLSLAFWTYVLTYHQKLGIIMMDAPVHSSPSQDSPALFNFNEGDEVSVFRENENWIQVQKSATALGWIKKEQLFVHSGF
jgi:tetratricopeptide (TPR) repeat protein